LRPLPLSAFVLLSLWWLCICCDGCVRRMETTLRCLSLLAWKRPATLGFRRFSFACATPSVAARWSATRRSGCCSHACYSASLARLGAIIGARAPQLQR
jgi:hypothetical protein